MNKERIIATAGLSDEQAALLRLLVRQAGKSLNEQWRWGTEIRADLLVVDPNSFSGHMARTRAQASGMRCAILCDADYPEQDGLILREPLKLDQVIAVLTQATQLTVALTPLAPVDDEFYFRDLASFGDASAPVEKDIWRDPARATPVALGLDELIRAHTPDRHERKPGAAASPGIDEILKVEAQKSAESPIKKMRLEADTSIAATTTQSARSQMRSDDARPGLQRTATPSNDSPNIRRVQEVDQSEHSIRDYLDGKATITTPSQIQLGSAPTLTLDPKNQVFHAAGGLSTLSPYCSRVLPSRDWKMCSTRELSQLRDSEPARPYAELIWLQCLLKGNGRLAAHLDPGGSYRLKATVSAETDFRHHGAIIQHMQKLARINEIAADAGTDMDSVFNLINAYDAIGMIEWTPRQRRQTGEQPAVPDKPSLLGKLGLRFRKK